MFLTKVFFEQVSLFLLLLLIRDEKQINRAILGCHTSNELFNATSVFEDPVFRACDCVNWTRFYQSSVKVQEINIFRLDCVVEVLDSVPE